MHGDEAVHAFKFRELWEKGVYRYDPNEFHGPTLYYAALPVMCFVGVRHFAHTSEGHYRVVTAVFGAGLVLLLALLADGLGWPATLGAGVLTAISPAFVFYSRYYIQEMLLVFFALGMLGTGWRYARSLKAGWLVAAGLCAGLMVASKETAVLAFGAVAIALAPMGLLSRFAEGQASDRACWWVAKHGAAALLVALLAAWLLLSGFLSNPSGPLGYLQAYGPWFHRAQATDLHRHPWHYYLDLLIWTHRQRGPVWSEGLILGLATAGLVVATIGSRSRLPDVNIGLIRFLGLYTLVLIAAYSLVPYKTPWCLLSFLQGLILLAGVGAVALVRLARGKLPKAIVGLLLLLGAAHLTRLSYQTSYVYNTDGRNPYAYAQPVPDIVDLGARVEGLSRASPQHEAMVIKVLSADSYYWPLPWYLRRFPNVGYWTRMPEDVEAPIVLASPKFDKELARRLSATHQMTGYYGLRPMVLFEVWVQRSLWQGFLKTRKNVRTTIR